ncbi:MAG: nucleotidyltransferase family protein [Methylobacteriaceae bacterium]|nr:nucleotidyltransferase family protein [Methylobacteriaceae bacterium]MBV9245934.1 nucleotidyltransferase family protein [Methylobacteriaceae bacterium]MBV9702536.1 nucleotidyltransferase family protein [Methylobacteriaceae bacterium]
MVFAAGLGRRMRPLTEKLPKPLVRVAGKTLIDHMLDRCADAGVRKVVVNVHYLADQIEAHLTPRRRPRIVISDERSKLLDQGGGIRKALPELGRKPFFICNTDALWLEGPRSNLRRFTAAWDPERMDVLLLVADTATSVGVDWPGDFSMDADGRLAKRDERLVAPFVYAGVGILKPELFAGVSAEIFKLAPFFFAAAERGRLFGMRLDGIWLHVGTPDAIVAADRAIERSLL